MFKYFNKFLKNVKISAYNYMYTEPKENEIICKTFIDDDKLPLANIDDKKLRELRIDTLLFVKQYKNTYYKYTNKEKFNHELYNTFLNDKNFDGGDSGYDDDDEIRIFDRYILEYIKNRSDVMTFLVCKNKDVILKNRIDELTDIYDNKSNTIDILFTIDMSEKDLFTYCYGIISKEGQISSIKNIVFSLVCKYKGEYVRMKLSAFTNDKKNHPYIILESFLT
jgi:hypothetical protein